MATYDPYATLFGGTKIEDVNNIYNQPNPSGSGLFGPMTVNQAQNVYTPPTSIPASPTTPRPVSSGGVSSYSPNSFPSVAQPPVASAMSGSTPPGTPPVPSGTPGSPTTPRPTTTGTDAFGNAGDWVTNPNTGINEFVKAGGMPSWYSRNPYDEFTKPVNEDDIRNKVLSSQERIISAIRESAAAELARKNAELTQTKDENAGQVRGLNIASGTAGSPIATTRSEEVNKNYTKAYDAAKRESDLQANAQIQTLLGTANTHADNLIEAAKQERLGAVGASQKYIDSIKDQSRADVAKIAGSGQFDLDRFKNSTAFNAYAQQTGMSPQELELYYAANMKKSAFTAHVVNKTLAVYEDQPDGTRIYRADLSIPNVDGADGDYDLKIDNKGNAIYAPKKPDLSKPNGGIITYNQPGSTYGDKPVTDYQSQQLDLASQRLDLAIKKAQGTSGVDLSTVNYQPYLNTSNSGVDYLDASTIQGTAAQKKAIVDAATSAGIKVITNKNTAADLVNIKDANDKLTLIGTILSGIDQPNALSRDLYGLGLTKFATLAQTNPQQAAAGALQSVGLDILKAISGIQGFRGNQSAIQQVTDHLPSIYDTDAVVKQKIEYINGLISSRENAIVGNSSSTDSSTIDSDIEHAIHDPTNFPTREALITALVQHYGITQQEAQQRVYGTWKDNVSR